MSKTPTQVFDEWIDKEKAARAAREFDDKKNIEKLKAERDQLMKEIQSTERAHMKAQAEVLQEEIDLLRKSLEEALKRNQELEQKIDLLQAGYVDKLLEKMP